MKTLAAFVAGIALMVSAVALAAPTETYQKSLYPLSDSLYELGSSTRAWLKVTTDELCLAADCKTAWPSGSSQYWNYSSTLDRLTPATSTSGILVTASSTIGAGTQTTGLTVNGGATTTLNHYIGGSLGIGSTSPNFALSVAGEGWFDSGVIVPFGAGIDFNGGNSPSIVGADFGGGDGLSLLTDNTERLFIDFDGDVGIGTTSPGNLLSVSGGPAYFAIGNNAVGLTLQRSNAVTANTSIDFRGINVDWYTGVNAAGNYAIRANSSDINTSPLFVVASSTGHVGIGTTSPTGQLSIFDDVSAFGAYAETADDLLIQTDRNSGWIAAIESRRSNSSNQKLLRLVSDTAVASSNNFEIANSAGTYFVANNGGNIGIGNTAPTSKLYVNGDITAANLLATSTTATSTFAGGLTVDGNDFMVEPDASQVSVGITPSTLGLQKFAVYNNLSASSGTLNAGVMRSDFTGSATSSATISGLYAIAQLHPSATQGITGTVNGVLSQVANADTGLLATARGIYTDLSNNTGTITNTYGVYVGDVTSGTQTNTAHSFYAADTSAFNYFGGNMGVGTTSPYALLSVQGLSGSAPLFTVASSTSGAATSTAFHITSDGKIGVSSTTPLARFGIRGILGDSSIFQVASSTNDVYFNIGSTGTTSIIGPVAATSSQYMYSTASGKGAQIIMEDMDGAGCTGIVTLNGTITSGIVTCPPEI
jgi:hypothetical protein